MKAVGIFLAGSVIIVCALFVAMCYIIAFVIAAIVYIYQGIRDRRRQNREYELECARGY